MTPKEWLDDIQKQYGAFVEAVACDEDTAELVEKLIGHIPLLVDEVVVTRARLSLTDGLLCKLNTLHIENPVIRNFALAVERLLCSTKTSGPERSW